jgi:putative tricarboxylic transport membrane protein
MLEHLLEGFQFALRWDNLLYCFLGCLWGTVVGVLPGLGPLAGLTLLLPLTYYIEPGSAIIMLAGIFYGAMYGGSISSVLLNIPGEAASIVTCIDGHQMARQGRAGPALVICAVGSFVGGTLSVVGLGLFAPMIARLMLDVGPAAEFLLMLLALVMMGSIGSRSMLKTAMMILTGLLIATVGMDQITAHMRFTFGSVHLSDGISFVAMALGLFGISEILLNLEGTVAMVAQRPTLRSLIPRRADLKEAAMPIARGSLIGFVMGTIPGVSHVISTFLSYSVEKKLSRHPERFGHGAIAGVAGPETANNATTGSAMIPLTVLGIPAIPATAILLSALMIHGIQPGPELISKHADVFWGLIASMYVGNLILLILNLPLVGLFVNLLRTPYAYLAPAVLVICLIGIYAINASVFDIQVMLVFGLVGYLLRKADFDVAPLLLAVVLGERIEVSLRRALIIADGQWLGLFAGPAARLILLLFLLLFAAQWLLWRRAKRTAATTGQ